MTHGLYASRQTWLHHVPAGPKLLALGLFSSALFFVSSLILLLVAASLSGAIYLSLGRSGAAGRRLVAMSLCFGAAIGMLHLWQGQPTLGAGAALRLFAATAAGVSFTLTTRYDIALEAMNQAMRPLQAWGIRTGRLTLALALMLRFADHFFHQWNKLDEAHRLRTGRQGGIRLMAPLCIQMLQVSHRVGETLSLRLQPAPDDDPRSGQATSKDQA